MTKAEEKVTLLAGNKICDVCKKDVDDYIFDAKTVYGPWAFLCVLCFQDLGIDLGTGLGQMYQNIGKEWIKIKG